MTDSIKKAEELLVFWPDTNSGPTVVRALVEDLKAAHNLIKSIDPDTSRLSKEENELLTKICSRRSC